MGIDHVLLQYQRLERYYQESLERKDPISFLDLAHCLRIWVDMRNHIDAIARSKNVSFRLANTVTSKVKGHKEDTKRKQIYISATW